MDPHKIGKRKEQTDGSAGSRPMAAVTAIAVGALAGALVLRRRKALSVLPDPAVTKTRPAAEMQQVVGYLQEHLGQKATAYLSGVDNVRLVGRWVQGKAQPEEP